MPNLNDPRCRTQATLNTSVAWGLVGRRSAYGRDASPETEAIASAAAQMTALGAMGKRAAMPRQLIKVLARRRPIQQIPGGWQVTGSG